VLKKIDQARGRLSRSGGVVGESAPSLAADRDAYHRDPFPCDRLQPACSHIEKDADAAIEARVLRREHDLFLVCTPAFDVDGDDLVAGGARFMNCRLNRYSERIDSYRAAGGPKKMQASGNAASPEGYSGRRNDKTKSIQCL
jgi:hypothetical protein